ncbi:inner membrane transporter RhtA [Kytococcus aerolatus]|uniref:Inner membrane transporter RhtA n=1 Tax=Kytococcus aerolatus TaxID=592308 RepID=A0A212T081_9MICO|nr:EamA family transporter [Kytococcus aerolatus]SNC59452.1 inner membrane transporter RhtA [Kytococcus aerolatus]
MTPTPALPAHPTPLGPVGLVLLAVASVQVGGAFAATLLPTLGVLGTTALRLGLAAAVLLAVARPSLAGRTRQDWSAVLLFAAAMTLMNTAFYGSLTRLPLGVAVTIEFTGPLVMSAVLSRTRRDLLAVLAAAAGVLLVSGALRVLLGGTPVDPLGVLLAALAGACWCGYILTSARTGQHFAGLDGVAIAMGVGAVVLLPWGLPALGTALGRPELFATALGVALASSAIPYSLELVALRRLPARVFGVLLSLEPAAAAAAGAVVLGQALRSDQLVGTTLVVLASVVVMTGRRPHPAG